MQHRQAQGSRRGRTRLTLTLLLGVGLGVVATMLLRAPPPAAFVGPGPAAQVTDRAGRKTARPPGSPLRAGDRVQADAQPVRLTIVQTEITLQPSAAVTVLAGTTSARLEQGAAVIDATATSQEVRIATASGEVVVASSRVEVLATAGAGGALTFIRVDSGSVRLEGAGRDLALRAGERGLLAAGRPPLRTPEPPALPAALVAADEPAKEEREEPAPPPPSIVPVVVPVAVAPPIPAAVPTPTAVVAPVMIPIAAPRGTIQGVVELDGVAPPPDDPAPAACEESGDGAWVVTNGRLANVHVQVASAAAAPPPKGGPAPAVSHGGCAFSPRVAAVQVGQTLDLRAGDGSAHGLRITQGAKAILDGVAGLSGRALAWTAAGEGVFRLHCDQHPHARAHLAVSAHPYFAVTGRDGTFRIAGVPAGRHTVRAWHERGGDRTASVVVVDGATAEVRLAYEGERPVAAAEPPPEPPPEDPPCRLAVAGASPVAQACAAGGLKRARAVMREVVLAARVRGVALLTCRSCHADERTYELAPGARERLGQVLTAFALQSYAAFYGDPRLHQRGKRDRRAGR